ncbi:DUF1192 family protein [Aestuariivirga sp.]|uniref:DUF1192 family protein n=1 Tax=Aestuariivirga sp. TaxID=2650926 RepID=UPI0039E5B44C
MDPDDLPQKTTRSVMVGEPLENHSVAELEQRLEVLDSEIARVKAVLAAKRASKSAADVFFRS